MNDGHNVARAIDALKRGWPVEFTEQSTALQVAPIETSPVVPETCRGELLVSAARAVTLKLLNQRAAARPEAPALIAAAEKLTPDYAMAIADPVRDIDNPLKGPFRALDIAAENAAANAMHVARLAGILPAFYVLESTSACEVTVSGSDLAAYNDPVSLQLVARAKLPVAAQENAEIIAFRSRVDTREHVALVLGKQGSSNPVVRLHSECLTGDVLNSLKCDCGPQLAAALAEMGEAEWGVLLYLRQEGRGIGLINKLRAYAMQDQGFDTVDANNRLGFPTEARDFEIAAHMLWKLGIDKVRLMTNNPAKVDALTSAGIEVIERVPLSIAANRHNQRYLATKRDRTGHQL